MAIDKVAANLYTCCKCKYQWTRWNGKSNIDQKAEATTSITTTIPLPKRCPKCKSVRWNQRYLGEELALIDRLQDELYETGLIRESGEKIEYEGNGALGTKPRTIYPYDYDFISYDLLKQMFAPYLRLPIMRRIKILIPCYNIMTKSDILMVSAYCYTQYLG